METKIFGDKKLTFHTMTAKEQKFAKEYLDFVNSLIDEEAKILFKTKLTLKQEKEWLKTAPKDVKSKKKVFLIAKDGDKVVANTSVELNRQRKDHIGEFAIGIRDGYRGIGLGKYVMSEVLKMAKKDLLGLKIFKLEVYENNKPAIALYKKMGFKEVGKIPKAIQHNRKLIGEYIMIKDAKN
jgi:ribosomal protein S18 acetylase RimI-like enzyme